MSHGAGSAGSLPIAGDSPADGGDVVVEDEDDAGQDRGCQDRRGHGPPRVLGFLAEVGGCLGPGEGQHAEHGGDDDAAEAGRAGAGGEDVRLPVAAGGAVDEDREGEREQDPEFEGEQREVGSHREPDAKDRDCPDQDEPGQHQQPPRDVRAAVGQDDPVQCLAGQDQVEPGEDQVEREEQPAGDEAGGDAGRVADEREDPACEIFWVNR